MPVRSGFCGEVPLSHRERVRLALEHKGTDRVPIGMVCSGVNQPARDELDRYLRRCRGIGLGEYLQSILDIRDVAPWYVGPPLRPREDIWGVIRKEWSYGPGAYDEIDHYPLRGATTIDDVRKHRWPSTDWFDYESIAGQIRRINATEEFCIIASGGNPFETTWYMYGFERTLTDLAAAPDLIDCTMTKVTDFYVAHCRKVLEAARGSIDLVLTADDIAGQRGLVTSPQMWERHIRPHHARINEVVHRYGASVIYHSDGGIMEAVQGLVGMGVDVLQALQFDANGMDPELLKGRYGDRLCFQGGVSVQRTLPFGTPEAVRQEVVELIRLLARGGGYIVGPSHCIQAGTPPENIVAMFDAAISTPLPP